MNDPSRQIKKALDMLGSGMLILILSPVYILIALAIWISSGRPILFRQYRLGKDAVPFLIYKFRTMIPNAPDIRNPDGSTFNAADDPRLTPIGRFLRRTSLDELPQLINILKGEMSFVGPRPEVVDVYSDYEDEELKRLFVRPGITGWAAINGRNSISLHKRRQYDIEYVDHWSLGLDLKILLYTVPIVLFSKDIYVANNFIQKDDRKYEK